MTAASPSLTGLALSAASVAYGAAAPTITAPTSASSGAITYSSSNTAVFSVSGSTITVVGVGTATLTATQAANGNYASTTQTTDLTVTAASPSLTGLALSAASVAYGAAAPTITAPTSASSGAITYSSSNTAVFSVSGSTITVVGVGTATLTATQAANGNYAGTTQTTDLTVTALGTQATPDFSLSAGAITFGTTVTISSAGSDAIYYTTDGSTPTTASTNQATTALVINAAMTVKALAVKSGYNNSVIASASYTQAPATAPSAVTLAVGSLNPVAGGITNVAIPADGATDTTGAVNGWISLISDKIIFTVANGGASNSTITINGSAYVSGDDYAIGAAGTLIIVVTTTETGKVTGVRTFSVSVAALPTNYVSLSFMTWSLTQFADWSVNWNTANGTCNTSTALGLAAGAWRLPTFTELLVLAGNGDSAMLAAGWPLYFFTWSYETLQPGGPWGANYVSNIVRQPDGNNQYYAVGNGLTYVICVH